MEWTDWIGVQCRFVLRAFRSPDHPARVSDQRKSVDCRFIFRQTVARVVPERLATAFPCHAGPPLPSLISGGEVSQSMQGS
jgi:hypothetical protein